MSAYNEVISAEDEVCSRCGSTIRRAVQFKFGDTWQHRFAIGDSLRWGGNDFGERGHTLVVVLGYPTECPVCGYESDDNTYDITIRREVLEDVRPSDGTYDYGGTGRTYFIIQP